MKTITFALAAAALLTLGACGSTAKSGVAKDSAASATTAANAPIKDAFGTIPTPGSNYGAGVSAKAQPMDYATFVKTVEAKGSIETVVAGTVLEVCQKKGCWMTLQALEGAENLSVRFKDYGFFMPKTLSGSRVLVEGTAKRTEVSVADLRHYAEDAGKTAAEIAAITEPEVEIELTATGVRVL